MTDDPVYQVALSFAGEQRDYVQRVASELAKRGVAYFYDEDQAEALWGKDLHEEFQRIYKDSTYVVMFISAEYKAKPWTRHERRWAFEGVIAQNRDRVLPVRFDATELPGLNTNLGYLRASDCTPEELGDKIERYLIRHGGRVVRPKPSFATSSVGPGASDTCSVQVVNQVGDPVEGAQVVFVARNGTTTEASTDAVGSADLPVPVHRQVTVMVAHESVCAAFLPEHDNHENLSVTLPDGDGRGSVVLPGTTGHIPGFAPRLSPLGDGHDANSVPSRQYLYVGNASINGSAEQPYHFDVGAPLLLEDHEGQQVRVTCVAFVGSSTLWEYEFPS